MKLAAAWGMLFAWIFAVAGAEAQAIYAASHTARLQVGAGGLDLGTDYSPHATQGGALWGDYDFSRYLGIEAEARLGSLRAPDRIAERSYAVGPRVSLRRGRTNLFGTLTVGQGTISNRLYKSASTFNFYGYGVGLEFLLAQRINLRVGDVEVQRWLSFSPRGLSPVSILAGVSYVLR